MAQIEKRGTFKLLDTPRIRQKYFAASVVINVVLMSLILNLDKYQTHVLISRDMHDPTVPVKLSPPLLAPAPQKANAQISAEMEPIPTPLNSKRSASRPSRAERAFGSTWPLGRSNPRIQVATVPYDVLPAAAIPAIRPDKPVSVTDGEAGPPTKRNDSPVPNSMDQHPVPATGSPGLPMDALSSSVPPREAIKTGVFGTNQRKSADTVSRQQVPAPTGFSNGVIGGAASGAERKSAQIANFGSAAAGRSVAVTQSAHPDIIAPVVLSEPSPHYTLDALKAHTEGEVTLQIQMKSSGEVEVLKKVHGLGNGLDEEALRVAQGIRFTPASKHGVPVDQISMVHVHFQLAGDGATAEAQTARMPMFSPWPPPPASDVYEIPTSVLNGSQRPLDLGGLNLRLSSALETNGYATRRYFSVPGGFAIVTRLEQTNVDGSPKQPPDRWNVNGPTVSWSDFVLADYLHAIVNAPGYFQVLVFVVSGTPFAEGERTINRGQATALLRKGFTDIDQVTTAMPNNENVHCQVMVYEFENRKSDDADAAKVKYPSRLPAQTHIKQNGLWASLASENPSR